MKIEREAMKTAKQGKWLLAYTHGVGPTHDTWSTLQPDTLNLPYPLFGAVHSRR